MILIIQSYVIYQDKIYSLFVKTKSFYQVLSKLFGLLFIKNIILVLWGSSFNFLPCISVSVFKSYE